MDIHVVLSGETIDEIAEIYGVSSLRIINPCLLIFEGLNQFF